MADLTPEQRAREQIDAQLAACGWVVQDYKTVDFSTGRGIALREVPLKTGPCDYLLLVDRAAVGVIEAKKAGATLSIVAEQSARYASSLPDFLAADRIGPLPFLYESTGVETFFRDSRDPDPRSRRVFSFHRPETLGEWFAEPDTLRTRLAEMPELHPLATNGMRECQVEAITGLEKSFAESQPRANLERYRASVLKAACEGRLVPTDTNSWKKIALGEIVVSMKNGIYKPRASYANDGIACLRMYNIYGGKIAWRDIKRMRISGDERSAYELLPGDLLVNRVNSRELVGKAAVIPLGLEPCVFESKNIRVRLKPQEADPRFVSIALSATGSTYFNRNAQQVVGMASISQPQIARFPLSLPPLANQVEIVAEVERRLSVVEELEGVVSANLQRATRLHQSILQQAFMGQLVPHETKAQQTDFVALPDTKRARRPNAHFLRAVLSGEIVHRLHKEPTFGRVKHLKIFNLCEHIARLEELKGEYHREAAGPLDNKLIYANIAELKKQKWYQEVDRDSRHIYVPLARAGAHRKYLERYWPKELPAIEKLIERMRHWDTERCEMFCTAYAAWNDLIIWGKPATEAAILHEILERWHEKKQRIPKERWLKAISWIKKAGFVPTGFGTPTADAPEASRT